VIVVEEAPSGGKLASPSGTVPSLKFDKFKKCANLAEHNMSDDDAAAAVAATQLTYICVS
jgi:hypothetical protein